MIRYSATFLFKRFLSQLACLLCCFGYDLFDVIIIVIKNNSYLSAMDTYLKTAASTWKRPVFPHLEDLILQTVDAAPIYARFEPNRGGCIFHFPIQVSIINRVSW